MTDHLKKLKNSTYFTTFLLQNLLKFQTGHSKLFSFNKIKSLALQKTLLFLTHVHPTGLYIDSILAKPLSMKCIMPGHCPHESYYDRKSHLPSFSGKTICCL